MSRPTVRTIDAITGDVTDRSMTDKEYAEYVERQEMFANREAEMAARQTARESGRTKLKALGLTDDEIAALIP